MKGKKLKGKKRKNKQKRMKNIAKNTVPRWTIIQIWKNDIKLKRQIFGSLYLRYHFLYENYKRHLNNKKKLENSK